MWSLFSELQAKLSLQGRKALLQRIRVASEGSFSFYRGANDTLTTVPFGHESVRVVVAALVQVLLHSYLSLFCSLLPRLFDCFKTPFDFAAFGSGIPETAALLLANRGEPVWSKF